MQKNNETSQGLHTRLEYIQSNQTMSNSEKLSALKKLKAMATERLNYLLN